MTLEELVGQRFVFGIPGTAVTPEILQHFKDTHAGGLILYRHNFESPDKIRKLISDLEHALGRKLLVCVDHEGGRVIMFRDGITVFPSAQAIGKTGDTQWARFQGEQEGRELRRLGIDVNFAPVLDVLTESYSPNIGIRSFGADPDLVAKMGAARISAMQVEGVSACAKHFPGLGPATLDPHVHLPTIEATWEDIERVHIVPFMRAMRTAVHSIMTSHPLYPNLDPTPRTPATFSRKIVYDYLRQKIGYKGVIFSDDLEMGAITELCPIGEAAVKTAHAGHDMILVCHSLKAERDAYDALLEAYRARRLPQNELEDSVKRIQTLASKRPERFTPLPATELRAKKEKDDAQAAVKAICDRSVSVLKTGPALSSSASTVVIAPKIGPMAQRIMIEPALTDEKAFLEEEMKVLGVSAHIHLTDLFPDASQIESAAQAAEAAGQAILLLYDAHDQTSNKALLEAIQSRAKKLSIVLLRDVYDQSLVQDNVMTLTNYGFRACDIRACLQKIFAPAPVSA